MKRCPTCNRTYADETLSYCLDDGSVLSAPYDPEATQRLAAPPAKILPPTEILPPEPSPVDTRPRNNRSLYITVAVLAMIAVGGATLYFKFIKKEGSQSEPLTAAAPTSSSPTVTSPANTPKNAQTNAGQEATANQNQSVSDKSDPNISGQLPIPKIYGKTYDEARGILIKEGWQPNNRHQTHGDTVDVKSGNGPIFWEKGYWELDSCSGTGLAPCRFEFVDPSERILVIITEGEEAEDGEYHATVSRTFLKSKS
jgi:hypothetical protein